MPLMAYIHLLITHVCGSIQFVGIFSLCVAVQLLVSLQECSPFCMCCAQTAAARKNVRLTSCPISSTLPQMHRMWQALDVFREMRRAIAQDAPPSILFVVADWVHPDGRAAAEDEDAVSPPSGESIDAHDLRNLNGIIEHACSLSATVGTV